MTVPMDWRLIGRWRIVEADLWDRAHLDLVEPAMMTIGGHGRGEITFGAMQGGLELGRQPEAGEQLGAACGVRASEVAARPRIADTTGTLA